jgi:hypothetical protein
MSDIFGALAVFILSFLGLIMVVLIIFFLYLAYRYDISFTIQTKGKVTKEPEPDNNEPIP